MRRVSEKNYILVSELARLRSVLAIMSEVTEENLADVCPEIKAEDVKHARSIGAEQVAKQENA